MKAILRSFIIIAILLAIWQLIVRIWQLPDYILPAPTQVFSALYSNRAIIAHHALITLIETILGFVLGILFGCLAGASIAYFRLLALWLLPVLIISQAIPTFAIAPLLVIWLGYGLTSKVATAILMIFFPVASAFYDGLSKTHSGFATLAKVMHASPIRYFFYIRLPLALPTLASGIRIAAVIAPIGAIVGEWVGSSKGLGYLMLNANARLQIDVMFAALIVIIMLALFLYFMIDWLLKKLIWWQSF